MANFLLPRLTCENRRLKTSVCIFRSWRLIWKLLRTRLFLYDLIIRFDLIEFDLELLNVNAMFIIEVSVLGTGF